MNIPKFSIEQISPISSGKFGPEYVYRIHDPEHRYGEFEAWLVIHNPAVHPEGTGKGGTGMSLTMTQSHVEAKAEEMAYKQFLTARMGEEPHYPIFAGGKMGIRYDDFFSKNSEKAIEVAAGVIRTLYDEHIIPQRYIVGLDIGVDERLAELAVYVCDGLYNVATGKPEHLGGIPYNKYGLAGRGTVAAVEEMCFNKCIELFSYKTTCSIKGFGAVGKGVLMALREKPESCRPKLLAISDKNISIYDPNGLDVDLLWEIGQDVQRNSPMFYPYTKGSAQRIPENEEMYLPVQALFVTPAATSFITMQNVAKVRARVVGQGSNLGITREAEEILYWMGVGILPAKLVNAASAASVGPELASDSLEKGIEYAIGTVRHNARYTLKAISQTNETPLEFVDTYCEQLMRKHMNK